MEEEPVFFGGRRARPALPPPPCSGAPSSEELLRRGGRMALPPCSEACVLEFRVQDLLFRVEGLRVEGLRNFLGLRVLLFRVETV